MELQENQSGGDQTAPAQILVLGMHRSGTSAVTRLLNLMGAYVGGDEELWGGNIENPKGFWERRDVERLNQRVLEEAGADWFRVRSFGIENLASEQRESFRRTAREIVEKLDVHRPWVVKDPRLCLLLPLWREVLSAPVCVCVYRNPLEVADSLRTRNGFPRTFGLALWEAYVVASLQGSHDLPRVFVSYNRLLQNPTRELEALKAGLDALGVAGLSMPAPADIEDFLDTGNYRERESLESFSDSASGRQMRLFSELEAGVPQREATPPALSGGAIETLDLQESLFGQEATLKAAEQALAERSDELDRHGEAIGSLRIELQEVRDRCGQLESESERIRAREEQLASTLEQQRSREEQLASELEQQRSREEQLASELEQQRARDGQLQHRLNQELQRAETERVELQAVSRRLRRELQRQQEDVERIRAEFRERAELDVIRGRNHELRTDFFKLYRILAETRRDSIRVAGWIEALDRDLTGIFISKRWKIGRTLAPLSSASNSAIPTQENARGAVESWKSRRQPALDTLFKSVPDKAALADSAEADKIRLAAKLLAQHVPRLREAARTSSPEILSLARQAEALAQAAADVLASASWRVGDLVVGGARRLAGSAKAVHWAPAEIRAIASELPMVLRGIDTRLDEAVLIPDEPSDIAAKEPGRRPATAARPFSVPPGSRDHTVVVPIHNAFADVQKCVASLRKYTGERTRILLIDDASTDDRIWPFLCACTDANSNVEALRNESNLGFTGTINRGLEQSTGDVVILNSDTEVTPQWLDKLEDAAYSRKRVATVTPLTNAGSAFAVPRNNAANELPAFMTPEMANAAVEALSERLRPEAPTGNGFCMYIRRDAIEAVGMFDERAFPRGYGEENDFCLRAGARGFVHLIDDTTFVYHKEGASFLDDKQQLIAAGLKTINERYPGYDARIQEWLRHDELAVLRSDLESIWNGWNSLPIHSALVRDRRQTILHVVHEGTGGTLYHVDDLTSAVWYDFRCLRLETGGRRWRLSVYTGREFETIEESEFDRLWRVDDPFEGARSAAFEAILDQFEPDLVHVHHLLGSAPEVIDRCKERGARVVYSFHDFYAVCPSFNLLDDKNTFCGGHCTAGTGTCAVHIDWVRHPNLKHAYVHQWRRERVSASLAKCDRLISFSNAVRQLVVEHYPALDTDRYVVIPHGQDVSEMRRAVKPPGKPPVRVLVLGGLSVAKGVILVERLLKINQERGGPFEFHFVGNVTPGYDPGRYGGIMHGPYLRESLSGILESIGPSFALVASPWSETFCYTLSECWAAGIPVLASDLGTQKERVEATGGGWLLDPHDAEAWYHELVRLYEDGEEYAACVERVNDIEIKSLESMKRDYLELYASLLANAVDVPAGVVLASRGYSA